LGRESRDYGYIEKYGQQKCESNALFKNDVALSRGRGGEEMIGPAVEILVLLLLTAAFVALIIALAVAGVLGLLAFRS